MSTTRAPYSALSSPSRVEILHQLQRRSQRSIAELTAATGLHPNTVREHLQRLIDGGYVASVSERRTTRGRPRVLYSAATDAAASPVARKKVRAAAQRGDLMRRVLPCGAPTLPADALHQLDALLDDLGDAGFEPRVDEERLTIELAPCPYADTPAERRSTLCGVHRGLMSAVLAQSGGPLRIAPSAPTADRAGCVVQLMR